MAQNNKAPQVPASTSISTQAHQVPASVIDSKDVKKLVEEINICSVCLDPIGWTYPLKPYVGTMCIECSVNWAKTKDTKADIKDPATTLVLPKCPWCNMFLNAFITSSHYSRCSEAPDKMKEINTSLHEEHRLNTLGCDRWREYMTLKLCSAGIFGTQLP